MATAIPPYVVEYFLLGRTREGALERFIQDAGVAIDVWLAFAKDPTASRRVLVAPARAASSVVVGHALHEAITAYRAAVPYVGAPEASAPKAGTPEAGTPEVGTPKVGTPKVRTPKLATPNVSPLESFVALTIYFDELVRILLPLTGWWHQKHLRKLRTDGDSLKGLSDNIRHTLGSNNDEVIRDARVSKKVDNRVLEAAPVAALLGIFDIAVNHPVELEEITGLDPHRNAAHRTQLMKWIAEHAAAIDDGWKRELKQGGETWQAVTDAIPAGLRRPSDDEELGENRTLIERVFLDRHVEMATEANCTIKADAAKRLFSVSCRGITWAVIDSGIATTHPAFDDHYPRKKQPAEPPRRIIATLDFTEIQRIRNFDLKAESTRAKTIEEIIAVLVALPGRKGAEDPEFVKMATENLNLIGQQLAMRLPPDWNLIEPLIRITTPDDGSDLPSDHGTHVAGILGADWREADVDAQGTKSEKIVLQGVCPDIDLYDLRVVHKESIERTEFALMAALEYVQFVNARAGSNGPAIHGVNISMSIPHKVRSYGCGATPVCVACDRLVASGVIVVAAAGNRGWNEMELGFGNFVSSSITDPGNAREVITVGSTHGAKPHVYGVSFFSSRGPTGDGRIKPDLVAPGERIRGPIRGNADGELDGTSMAAPFVSGAAAMLISRHRELIGDPERVKQVLLDSATDLGREKYFQGEGLVDVLRAMQSI